MIRFLFSVLMPATERLQRGAVFDANGEAAVEFSSLKIALRAIHTVCAGHEVRLLPVCRSFPLKNASPGIH
jgi:hypothetical protein